MFSVCALVYTVNGMILILKVVNNGNRRRIKNKIKKIIKTITIPFILSTSQNCIRKNNKKCAFNLIEKTQ